jgi:hypothetical protein
MTGPRSWLRKVPVVLAALVGVMGTACVGGDDGQADGAPGGQTAAPPGSAPAPVPSLLEELVAMASMTDDARRLFLDARPEVTGSGTLRSHCREVSSGHTLGCFLVTRECTRADGRLSDCSRTTRIHLLRIDRADLSPLMYVSAAHEMLHAAYEDLSATARRRLDRDLETASAALDPCRLAANLGTYSTRSPVERLNELHSVLATEFATLPAALESHYSRYFRNRQAVVQAHQRTLGGRENEICGIRSRLDQLQAQLQGLREQLQQLRAAGNYRAYNARVTHHNALVADHNRLVDQHNRRVRDYNQLLAGLGSSVDALEPRQPAREPPR